MKLELRLVFISLALASLSFAAELPQLFENSEAGFADAQLAAGKVVVADDGSIAVTAVARVGKEDAGFRVILSPKWELWKPAGFPGSLYRGTVRIEGLGPSTEVFVRALAKAYGQTVDRFEFTKVTLTAISLEGDPRSVRSQPIKLKVFYETQKEAEYAEGFLNFDLPHGVVQFHEKDPEYRKAVIGYLTKKHG
jgi:hypothetical protein